MGVELVSKLIVSGETTQEKLFVSAEAQLQPFPSSRRYLRHSMLLELLVMTTSMLE